MGRRKVELKTTQAHQRQSYPPQEASPEHKMLHQAIYFANETIVLFSDIHGYLKKFLILTQGYIFISEREERRGKGRERQERERERETIAKGA